MSIILTNSYLDFDFHFEISHELTVYIDKQLNHFLLEDLQLDKEHTNYDLVLMITTNQETEVVKLAGPYVEKKEKSLIWHFFLPYEKIVSVADPRTALVNYFFDAAAELFPKYGVDKLTVREVQKLVELEVIDNPAYDLTEEEAWMFANSDISTLDLDPEFLKELELEYDVMPGQTGFPLIIRPTEEELLYWVIWHDNEDLVTQDGLVGETAKYEQIPLVKFDDVIQAMTQRYEDKLSEGYREVKAMERTEVIVEVEYKPNELAKAMETSNHFEALLNEWLGSTGNGYCVEAEIGKTIEIFCSVFDVEQAYTHILQKFKEKTVTKGIRIAYWNHNEDNHLLLYPIEQRGMSYTE